MRSKSLYAPPNIETQDLLTLMGSYSTSIMTLGVELRGRAMDPHASGAGSMKNPGPEHKENEDTK